MQRNIQAEDFQKAFDALQGLPLEQIQFILDRSEIRHYPLDSFLFRSEEPADNMTFILEGHFKIYIQNQGNTNFVAELNAGDITGLLPFSRMEKARANAVATEESWALQFPRTAMRELIQNNYELTESLVHLMTGRVRNFTTLQQQNERMVSLGKLSAGLAHELNNPTAAIGRSAKVLIENQKENLLLWQELLRLQKPLDALKWIQQLSEEILQAEESNWGILQQQEQEDEWLDYFEEQGYEDADALIEYLVSKKLAPPHFDAFMETWPLAQRKPILDLLSALLRQASLYEDVATAAERISELVGSIKSFTHMDQAQDKGMASLTSFLNSTLKILDHKLRKHTIDLQKDFPSDLPQIPLRIGQVNQVFTNLIDNAIDALKEAEHPQIKISIFMQRDNAFVKIEDNGPGIPEDLKALIFDPFFTTKGVGEGSGMGLEISRRIIEQHGGKLELESAQNPTIFSICLPSTAWNKLNRSYLRLMMTLRF